MIVENLIKIHKTNNPYIIAERLNIKILDDELGEILGYYHQLHGQKFIHVNGSLKWYRKEFIVAHLLYHALTNDDDKIIFWKNREQYWKENRKQKRSKYEDEGNRFATKLLFRTTKLSLKELCESKGLNDLEYKEVVKLLEDLTNFDIESMTVQEIFEHFT